MKVKPWTVILAYPLYMTDGDIELFCDHVTHAYPHGAVEQARKNAMQHNEYDPTEIDSHDFKLIAVLSGHVKIVRTHEDEEYEQALGVSETGAGYNARV